MVKITEKISQKRAGIFILRMLQIHVQIRSKKTQKSVSFVRIFIQKIRDLDAVLLEIRLEIVKELIFQSFLIFARTLIGAKKTVEMLSYVIAKWKARKSVRLLLFDKMLFENLATVLNQIFINMSVFITLMIIKF